MNLDWWEYLSAREHGHQRCCVAHVERAAHAPDALRREINLEIAEWHADQAMIFRGRIDSILSETLEVCDAS